MVIVNLMPKSEGHFIETDADNGIYITTNVLGPKGSAESIKLTKGHPDKKGYIELVDAFKSPNVGLVSLKFDMAKDDKTEFLAKLSEFYRELQNGNYRPMDLNPIAEHCFIGDALHQYERKVTPGLILKKTTYSTDHGAETTNRGVFMLDTLLNNIQAIPTVPHFASSDIVLNTPYGIIGEFRFFNQEEVDGGDVDSGEIYTNYY